MNYNKIAIVSGVITVITGVIFHYTNGSFIGAVVSGTINYTLISLFASSFNGGERT